MERDNQSWRRMDAGTTRSDRMGNAPWRRRPGLAELIVLASAAVCLSGAGTGLGGEAGGPAAFPSDPADRAQIDEALPARAAATPAKPRRLLIFDRNVGYGGHPSARHASYAFSRMGEKTGAFAAVVSQDPDVFRPESLRGFDAVFFNNTVGNLFEDPSLRRSLVEFIYAGGGMLGVHGTAVAFTKWPGAIEDWSEFGLMLGARGANHRSSDEHVFMKSDDPGHPLLRPFGPEWDYRDEFFRVHEPYSRNRVRVLWSIDTAKTDLNQGPAYGQLTRADQDYAVAWVRGYGRGRAFYCTIAHNPSVFRDPKMLEFYLGAIQFALGDLPAPTTPSARLTPAVRAQEKLGWRLGLCASPQGGTLFEAIDEAARQGLLYLEAAEGQSVSHEIPGRLAGGLTDDEWREVRLKLDSAGVRILTCRVGSLPDSEPACRQVFELGRKLGIEALVLAAPPASLEVADALAAEYRIRLALGGAREPDKASRGSPTDLLRLCRNRSEWVGIHADLGLWMRQGLDLVRTLRRVGDRLATLEVHDANRAGAQGRDVPWGTGVGRIETVLRDLSRAKVQPVIIGLPDPRGGGLSGTDARASADFLNALSLNLSREQHAKERR